MLKRLESEQTWEAPHAPQPALRPLRSDVLAINRVGFFGGVERVILGAAAAAQSHGWNTCLICPPGPLTERAAERGLATLPGDVKSLSAAEVFQSPWATATSLEGARRAAAQIRQAAVATGARILHAHHPASALQAAWAARTLRLPLIWHVHETAPMRASYWLAAELVKSSVRRFLCVSKPSADMILGLGAPADRIRLVHNAVDPEFLEGTREAAPWPGGPHVGLFGVLEPRKGHADLIQACAALNDLYPDLQLWIVGGEGVQRRPGYEDDLRRLADSLGLGERVRFTGARSDVPDLMRRMHVVVSASVEAESLPTVILEACALGVPVLATDVGGTSEIVRHCRTGFIVPPGAPSRLASGLALLLTPTGRTFAQRAKLDVRRRFSQEQFAASLHACYAELAGLGAGARA